MKPDNAEAMLNDTLLQMKENLKLMDELQARLETVKQLVEDIDTKTKALEDMIETREEKLTAPIRPASKFKQISEWVKRKGLRSSQP